MPTTDTDRQLHQTAQDIHLALGAAIEYGDTSMLADAVGAVPQLMRLHLPGIAHLADSLMEIDSHLKEGSTPTPDTLRTARERASVVVHATDPDTPDVATGPFTVEITESITHQVTVEQDFLDRLPHIIRQDDPTDIHDGSGLGDAILDAFVNGEFGLESETFAGCEERTIAYY